MGPGTNEKGAMKKNTRGRVGGENPSVRGVVPLAVLVGEGKCRVSDGSLCQPSAYSQTRCHKLDGKAR